MGGTADRVRLAGEAISALPPTAAELGLSELWSDIRSQLLYNCAPQARR
ncbi:hypothetical protein HLB23_00790 [Nocardia uniformis]|uniref:Uncharacterized protein n=1 Tax=Nocardia uniformis TaxID=53432 RepID=A0A849BQT3_9NOCA|nr:hypothetical protein [Nocardia uniformis]NNH68434.1 hypothetical protein [Nocardia uniformis]